MDLLLLFANHDEVEVAGAAHRRGLADGGELVGAYLCEFDEDSVWRNNCRDSPRQSENYARFTISPRAVL